MKLVIPFLGKTKSAWIEAGIQDYAARLGRYAQLEMPVLKDPYVHGAPEERTKELQAQALLAAARGAQGYWLFIKRTHPGQQEVNIGLSFSSPFEKRSINS